MKKRDLMRLHNGISVLEGRQFSVKFSYFIAKNKVNMRDEISALEEARKVSEKFKEFDTERAKLAHQYADKNEDGTAKIQDNSFVITANVDVFQEELALLKTKHSVEIEKRENQIKEYNAILDDTIDFKGTKIGFKDIPPTIEPSMLEVLILADLIIEED